MVIWSVCLLWKTLWQREKIFLSDANGLVLVHGDTFSTLIGALMARLARLKVGHVESGLRSFNYLNPFPEELTRVLVFRLSHIYFSPGKWALDNLSGYSGLKVDTHSNTLKDSLRIAVAQIDSSQIKIPACLYAIVSIHRFENIFSRQKLIRVIETIERVADRINLVFILHKPTEKKLRDFGLYERIALNPRIELRPRYDYFKFIKLVSRSAFVISDGGSNQEECHYLNKPVLLLRMATERQEGLGSNCTLSKFDPAVIDEFIVRYPEFRQEAGDDVASPSTIIAETCRPFA